MAQLLKARYIPSKIARVKVTYDNPLKIKIEKPVSVDLSEVKIEIYEMDTWMYKKNKWKIENYDKQSKKWDTIAEFNGEITGQNKQKQFIPSYASIDVVTKADCEQFKNAPVIPITFEGHDKRYKLDLGAKQSDKEYEGVSWELGLKISGKYKSREYTYKTVYIGSCIQEDLNISYLDNKLKLKSDKADISEQLKSNDKVHSSYIMMLKRHLTILGFYRTEKSERMFKYWKYKKKEGALPRFSNLYIDDKWNDELTRAVQHFQAAALQKWRIDGITGKFREISKVTFDKNDNDVGKEIKEIRIGDKTKEEIIRWLGKGYNKVNGDSKQPVYRNPFLYSFCNAYDIFHNTGYQPSLCMYDSKSGRIMNTKYHKEEGSKAEYRTKTTFVCTTAVNWFFSHLVCMGKSFKYSAQGSVVDAVLGYATPKYYNDTIRTSLGIKGISVKPAFLLPWMDERDPEREQQTMNFLKMHRYVIGVNKVKVRSFSVKNEIAQSTSSATIVTIRYRPKGITTGKWFTASSKNIRFKILNKSASAFTPADWTPSGRIKLSSKKNSNGYIEYRILFEKSNDSNILTDNTLLVTYNAYDTFCETKGLKAFKHYDDRYSCKCGLHKSYKEIVENKNNLKNWNIATQSDMAGLEHSTLTICKSGNELYAMHGDGKTMFSLLKDEARYWFESKRLHYLIFTVVNNDELLRINPVFYFNPDPDKLRKMELSFDYRPKVENKER